MIGHRTNCKQCKNTYDSEHFPEYCPWCYTDKLKLQAKITELKALLLKVGSTTHQCKELHDWYCANKKDDECNQ